MRASSPDSEQIRLDHRPQEFSRTGRWRVRTEECRRAAVGGCRVGRCEDMVVGKRREDFGIRGLHSWRCLDECAAAETRSPLAVGTVPVGPVRGRLIRSTAVAGALPNALHLRPRRAGLTQANVRTAEQDGHQQIGHNRTKAHKSSTFDADIAHPIHHYHADNHTAPGGGGQVQSSSALFGLYPSQRATSFAQ